jgi:hypothetical protein
MPMVQILGKKMRNSIRTEYDLNGSHAILKINVSEENLKSIVVPQYMINEMLSVIRRMVSAKIQFGVTAEFQNDEGVMKSWQVSNAAVIFDNDFINNETMLLKEKLENYSETSSGWSLLRIMEITLTITKNHDIIHRSGIIFINISLIT